MCTMTGPEGVMSGKLPQMLKKTCNGLSGQTHRYRLSPCDGQAGELVRRWSEINSVVLPGGVIVVEAHMQAFQQW